MNADDALKVVNIMREPKTAIVCRTQEEANLLLSMLNDQGIRWASGDSVLDHTNWEQNKEETEYNLTRSEYGNLDYLKFGDISWALKYGYNIICFEDIFDTQVSAISLMDLLSE